MQTDYDFGFKNQALVGGKPMNINRVIYVLCTATYLEMPLKPVYNYDYLIMLDACNKLRTLAPTMKNFNVSWHLPYFL